MRHGGIYPDVDFRLSGVTSRLPRGFDARRDRGLSSVGALVTRFVGDFSTLSEFHEVYTKETCLKTAVQSVMFERKPLAT